MPKDEFQAFDDAAELWEELGLPEFEVEGYLDGKTARWDVPDVLRTAARRLRSAEEKKCLK